jgi:hypothetical protein
MSAPLTVKIESVVSIDLPAESCTDFPVTVEYKGTESGTVNWNWDGGSVLSSMSDKKHTVQWTSAGVKNVTATVNGKTASAYIMIQATDLSFSLPAVAFKDVPVEFQLPDVITRPSANYAFRTSNAGITIQRREGTREAVVTFQNATPAEQWIEIVVADAVCGEQSYRQIVEMKGGIATPKISLVNIDAVTGKNKIVWDKDNANLTSDLTEILVYREGSRYNRFDLIGSVSPGAGEFIDLASNPQITTSRYRIACNTAYGVASAPSVPHRSTHLMLNKGVGAAINLMWTQYEGGVIESYRVYRGASPESLSLLTEVSGNVNSYTDLTPPDGLFYYAIEYDQTYSTTWTDETVLRTAPLFRATADELVTGRSNAVSVVNAQDVTPAQSLNILALEEELSLSQEQSELHLYAEIFPVAADYKIVNWLVTGGSEYAYINQQGLLTATGLATDGATVTVRATTVDGSNIWKEITIPYSFDGTGIDVVETLRTTPLQVYPNPAKDWIRIASDETIQTVEVIDLMGKMLFKKSFDAPDVEISISGCPKGHYLLRVVTRQGIVVRKIVKI